VSLNFSMDGMSGFGMGQSFTVDPDFLPYSYSLPDIGDPRTVAFVMTGLDHTIEGNQWTSDVRTNMIYGKKGPDFEKDKVRKLSAPDAPLRRATAAGGIGSSVDINIPADRIAASKISLNKIEYVKEYYPFAKLAGEKFDMDPILILSQSGLESAWGSSFSARKDLNFFGLTATVKNGEAVGRNEFYKAGSNFRKSRQADIYFRVYDNIQNNFYDYARNIRDRQNSTYQNRSDYVKYFTSMAQSSYISEENGDDRGAYRENTIANYKAIKEIVVKLKLT
jgi:flagellar protein FlgJ